MSESPDAIEFREFIVAKYKEQYDNFDEDELCIRSVEDYMEEWYDAIGCNINRRFVNITELMKASIDEDGYELYEYCYCDDKFVESVWDDEMCEWIYDYNKNGEDVTKFWDNGNVYVVKYMK